MKTWLICPFLSALVLVSCSKDLQSVRRLGSIDVAETIKTASGLTIQYSIPETEHGWHCVGANLNVNGDLVELSFVAAHDSDDGAKVDLQAENTKKRNMHQVHIPLHGLNEFSLVIDGMHYAGFKLGRTQEKTGEQAVSGNRR